MTTMHTDRKQDKTTQDQTGSLAESARRHIAYERLTRQAAASEEAARLVLAALARAGQSEEEDPREGEAQGSVYGYCRRS